MLVKYINSTLFGDPITSIDFTVESKTDIEAFKALVAKDVVDGDYILHVKVKVSTETDSKIFHYKLKQIHFVMMLRNDFHWEDAFLTTIQTDLDVEVSK